MRVEDTCSWCKNYNPLAVRLCRHCGHEAHVSRANCRCSRCAPAQARGANTDRLGQSRIPVLEQTITIVPPDRRLPADSAFVQTVEVKRCGWCDHEIAVNAALPPGEQVCPYCGLPPAESMIQPGDSPAGSEDG